MGNRLTLRVREGILGELTPPLADPLKERNMHEQDLALVKALVPVAWADGEFKEPEREMLSAILSAYRATPDDEKVIFDYAKEKRSLEDIELGELSAGDRRVLLQQAVLLTFADGNQAYAEREFLSELAKRLRIPDEEAKEVMTQAAERAKSLLNLL